MTTEKKGNTYEHGAAGQLSVEQVIEHLPMVKPKDLIASVFNEELTKKRIAELKKAYPKSKVPDMGDEANFKEARKTRTEMNRIVKAINDRKISFNNMTNDYAAEISGQVVAIYTPYVDAFLAEDKKRKEEKAKAAKILEERLNKERLEIQDLNTFITTCQGKDSQFIADTLESIDLVDTSIFHKDLIHEAIETKESVKARLTEMYQAQKAKEALEAEREAMEAEAAEAAKKAKVQERINNLQQIPMSMFGKHSTVIEDKVNKIKGYEVKESDFFERTAEVEGYKAVVIQQLESMLDQAVMVEQAQEQQRVAQEQQQAQERQQVEQLQADVTQAAEQDEATEAAEAQSQDLANEIGAFIPDADEPLLSVKSDVFESVAGDEYEPLDIWPSDDSRAQNDELNAICEQLEKAEDRINYLENKFLA